MESKSDLLVLACSPGEAWSHFMHSGGMHFMSIKCKAIGSAVRLRQNLCVPMCPETIESHALILTHMYCLRPLRKTHYFWSDLGRDAGSAATW